MMATMIRETRISKLINRRNSSLIKNLVVFVIWFIPILSLFLPLKKCMPATAFIISSLVLILRIFHYVNPI
jgi:glucose uptake protein GlcU